MALNTVKLKVDGYADREVTKIEYQFTRGTAVDGQPAGTTRGGKIEVTVQAVTNKANVDLLEWVNADGAGKNGSIEFKLPSDATKLLKTIKFTNAYCVDFKESWEDKGDATQAAPHTEKIIISCQELSCESASFENAWGLPS